MQADLLAIKKIFAEELPVGVPKVLPPPAPKIRDTSVPHAPSRPIGKLTISDRKLAVKNALRYFPEAWHEELAEEFYDELDKHGHIYMYRFRPTSYPMKAYPISCYPGKCEQANGIIFMIMNNLDPAVAQYPHELVTYGGNGSVLNNWIQFHLLMKYLCEMSDTETLSMYSGHPMGVFPSHKDAPRVVITNGLVIPNYSSSNDYEIAYMQGNTIYGQMTAGSYCYIGPQGIVHGTQTVVMNAGRKYLKTNDMHGKVFLTSGLGGMSGAQGKAAIISGAVAVVAEVNPAAAEKRYNQGWIMEKIYDLDALVARIKKAKIEKKPVSIAYVGNVVDVWERLANEEEQLVDLGSDQTSLHNPYNGGYYPAQISFQESQKLMVENPEKFKELVQESLRRQVAAINKLCTQKGMKFWDYGNSFLLEASRAGADVMNKDEKTKAQRPFSYPSYVQDIMGDIFAMGFGPFRWVCLSNDEKDLQKTDEIAAKIFEESMQKINSKCGDKRNEFEEFRYQLYSDNLRWIQKAMENKLVVGSQARILYSDGEGRRKLALAMNEAVRSGELSGPIAISRDHHDVSGADSPWRETSCLYDGSFKLADMATQTVIGNALRGATWVALHNGGGTGFGEAINCGFGFVLDGTHETDKRVDNMLFFDVYNGITRRSWSGNEKAKYCVEEASTEIPGYKPTIPHYAQEDLIDKIFAKKMGK